VLTGEGRKNHHPTRESKSKKDDKKRKARGEKREEGKESMFKPLIGL
jgi:hypothetical protein